LFRIVSVWREIKRARPKPEITTMSPAESASLCALYHIARARLLIDALADGLAAAPRATNPTKQLATTLRAINAELARAVTLIEQPKETLLCASSSPPP
jgi:hypothetical protein